MLGLPRGPILTQRGHHCSPVAHRPFARKLWRVENKVENDHHERFWRKTRRLLAPDPSYSGSRSDRRFESHEQPRAVHRHYDLQPDHGMQNLQLHDYLSGYRFQPKSRTQDWDLHWTGVFFFTACRIYNLFSFALVCLPSPFLPRRICIAKSGVVRIDTGSSSRAESAFNV